MIFQAVTGRRVTQLVSLAQHTRFYLSTNGFHDPSLTLDWLAQHFGRIIFYHTFLQQNVFQELPYPLIRWQKLYWQKAECFLAFSAGQCESVVDNMRDYVMALHITSVSVMIRSVPPLITTKTSLTSFSHASNIIPILRCKKINNQKKCPTQATILYPKF